MGKHTRKKLYIISDGTYFKVGVSSNPQRRRASLQTANPRKLTVRGVYGTQKGDIEAYERLAHCFLANLHVRGEWFKGPLSEIKRGVRQALEWDPGKMPTAETLLHRKRDFLDDGMALGKRDSKGWDSEVVKSITPMVIRAGTCHTCHRDVQNGTRNRNGDLVHARGCPPKN